MNGPFEAAAASAEIPSLVSGTSRMMRSTSDSCCRTVPAPESAHGSRSLSSSSFLMSPFVFPFLFILERHLRVEYEHCEQRPDRSAKVSFLIRPIFFFSRTLQELFKNFSTNIVLEQEGQKKMTSPLPNDSIRKMRTGDARNDVFFVGRIYSRKRKKYTR